MSITLNMLLTRYGALYPDTAFSPYSRSNKNALTGIRLLPPDMGACQKGCLYLFTREISAPVRADCSLLYVCRSNPENPPKGVTCLCTTADLATVFNAMQEIWDYFIDWGKQLDFAVFRDAPMQELVDISEPIIGNPVLVYDPVLRLLAYTRHTASPNDRLFRTATQQAYLPPEFVHHFESDNSFRIMHTEGSVSSETDAYRAHPDIIRSLKINGIVAAYLVLIRVKSEPKPYTEQIFEMFAAAVEALLLKQHSLMLQDRHISDYFLVELLNTPNLDEATIKDRLEFMDLPFESHYVLLSLFAHSKEDFSETYFIQSLRDRLPDCHVFPYEDAILILFLLPAAAVEYRRYVVGRMDVVSDLLSPWPISVCVSKPFHTLNTICAAFSQTADCHTLDRSGKPVAFFEDILVPALFSRSQSLDLLFDYCDPSLHSLLRADNEKSRYHLQILDAYLSSGCRISETARRLNMHRNNVIYHIDQLSETYQWDLEQEAVRMRLMLSFALMRHLDTTGANPLPAASGKETKSRT